MLPLGLTPQALELAAAEAEPDSLAASTRLRRTLDPDLTAAAVTQVLLRRRAERKFGAAAAAMLFTRDGLEQATRPEVAERHAARLVEAGVRRVVDLGCGIGADARAFAAAGLEVVAVERDPVTAAVAAYNLGVELGAAGGHASVRVGDAEQLAPELLTPDTAAFCDPARRNAAGRLWRTADFTPSWDFVVGLLDGSRVAGVKLGPALPHNLVPDEVEAEWVSHRGDTVEVALWAGAGTTPGLRTALVLPDHLLRVAGRPAPLPVSAPCRYLYEPDGAVIRAGAVNLLGTMLEASLLDPQIAYLTADQAIPTPYATVFEVMETLPYQQKVLRQWVREHRIGSLEIKKRGVEVDPAVLRRQLRPAGPGAATLVISRTPGGAVVLVVQRSRQLVERRGSSDPPPA